VSSATQFYVSSVLIIGCVDLMAAWGLNMQFGLAGINSFAFIVFQAVGAYAAGVVTLGSPIGGFGQEQYIGGALLPYPLPLLVAIAVAGLAAVPVGLVTLRRLRGDYEAMVMLVLSLIAVGVASAEASIVNGPAGIYGVPKPLGTTLLASLTPLSYQWVYTGWSVFLAALVCGVSWAISSSPFGRNLRALRENETVVISSGRNAIALRLQAFVIGAMIAGLSGGVAVEFIGAWSPGGWAYVETFV
jgi:ABC-type branched-subunit amino acid transport system permease subunit